MSTEKVGDGQLMPVPLMTSEADRESNFVSLVFQDPPQVHRGETEMSRTPDRSESGLDDVTWKSVPWHASACYGISRELADFLASTIQPGWKTLETGSGISTLIFAHRGAVHKAVTPNADEAPVLGAWATQHGVSFTNTTFATQASEDYLPTCDLTDLDCVLIDGKHAFPWPVIDWFYAARRLKSGGLLILDDIDLASVSILVDFLREDSKRWELVQAFGRSVCFRKGTDSVDDVAWHMQPFVTSRLNRKPPQGVKRILLGIKRRLIFW
jgi:Methyltransferase domain